MSRFRPLLTPFLTTAVAAAVAGCAGAEPASDEVPSSGAPEGEVAQISMPETDIWLATLDRTEDGLVLRGPENVTNRAGYENQPAFLPDGSFLYTRQTGNTTDIWRYDPATGSHTEVTSTPESEYSPTPLPAGDGFSVVRVEADGTQRLWQFDMSGANASVVFPDVAPVGYHAWADPEHAYLFILGDPPTLQSAERGAGGSQLLAEGIGPSIQKVPGRPAVSFVEVTEVGSEIETWTMGEAISRLVAEGVAGAVHHAWTPDGTLLQAGGNTVYAFDGAGMGWMEIGSLPAGLEVTRLAVSGDGTRLAVVAGPASAE